MKPSIPHQVHQRVARRKSIIVTNGSILAHWWLSTMHTRIFDSVCIGMECILSFYQLFYMSVQKLQMHVYLNHKNPGMRPCLQCVHNVYVCMWMYACMSREQHHISVAVTNDTADDSIRVKNETQQRAIPQPPCSWGMAAQGWIQDYFIGTSNIEFGVLSQKLQMFELLRHQNHRYTP